MGQFLKLWGESAYTTLGFFWMAFWAFCFGYLISSCIQVFVTEKRMKKSMGQADSKSLLLASFFGFISSSCSFAAMATTRSLFTKKAGLIPSLAFLLASTNLVIELGIVISLFLSWHFVVGEYIGGLLLIVVMAILVKFTLPKKWEEKARDKAKNLESSTEDDKIPKWKEIIWTKKAWRKVFRQYTNEWNMVWRDVTIGFTIAGIIANFVPREFFRNLFLYQSQSESTYSFLQILLQSLIGPLAAFFTFIGSMGNIPLAGILYSHGVSFAGIMAFIFSDLIVLPVLRIHAQYYGWKMALYIQAVFLTTIVIVSILMHYGFQIFNSLPSAATQSKIHEQNFFKLDYSFYINIIFALFTLYVLVKRMFEKSKKSTKQEDKKGWGQLLLTVFASLSLLWLCLGVMIKFI